MTRPRAARRCSSSTARNATARTSPKPRAQLANAPLKPSNDLEWRIEVIPLDHIGTDPNAAMGFMNRRYDLSATGLSNAELQAALRPLLTRQLLRDVRFRLREVVRLSTDRAESPSLPASLANAGRAGESYPDLESVANPAIPDELFATIDAAIVPPLPVPAQLPDVDWRPPDPLDCALECHLVNLLWDLRKGERPYRTHAGARST